MADTGEWVRLECDGATKSLDRWPGPPEPGMRIHSTDFGDFIYDSTGFDEDLGASVHVYVCDKD